VVLEEFVGYQDQIFASYGGLNHIKFYGHDRFSVERINVNESLAEELSGNLVMFYTGMTRRASDIEKVKMQRMDRNLATLDSMHQCVEDAREILSAGTSLDDIGRLLNETWKLKRSLSGDVSNRYIDEAYQLGGANGAIGGKLLGAGGGGFLLFYVPRQEQARFRRAFSGLHEVKFSLGAQGSTIIHAGA
jgi:D-glycero-alpha-D-manno-heptose-7-phosphate kinase